MSRARAHWITTLTLGWALAALPALTGLGCASWGVDGPPATCGNGFIEGAEQCDLMDFGGNDCAVLGYGGGSLRCDESCALITTGCDGASTCGNGMMEGTEYCDGADLGGMSCDTLNLGSGTLACTAACGYNTDGCALSAVCGNGVVEGNEQCDGPNLDGLACHSLGMGFDGGTLACKADCMVETAGCTAGAVCGNDVIESGEDCDGINLNGFSCVSLGYGAGSLSCTGSCHFDPSGCPQQTEDCANGVDDDNDSYIDCLDGDCFGHPACSDEVCNNGIDDDGDGYVDCDDPDCTTHASCITEDCTNGVDDDNNTFCDCNDFACIFDLNCMFADSENCTNGIDDDHDCLIDCADSDCDSDAACGGSGGCGDVCLHWSGTCNPAYIDACDGCDMGCEVHDPDCDAAGSTCLSACSCLAGYSHWYCDAYDDCTDSNCECAGE